ncbi:hypothetical protein DY000_02001004 [Brassica cretica]|uniref:Uncharacterized protein n=1 Tax=Brassica cretica TaxID=69181 RepID=A0ABQ7C1K3_BRACR|nr:hypothetical protein DY000_02001004 [Brassica cretica]
MQACSSEPEAETEGLPGEVSGIASRSSILKQRSHVDKHVLIMERSIIFSCWVSFWAEC